MDADEDEESVSRSEFERLKEEVDLIKTELVQKLKKGELATFFSQKRLTTKLFIDNCLLLVACCMTDEEGECVSRPEFERLREECAGVKLTECVDRQEFESLREEFAGVKTELEKRDRDVKSLKRG